MALGGFFGGNFGAAAGGALQAQDDMARLAAAKQAQEMNQIRLQQAREQQVRDAATANAQRSATEAFRKTMQSAYGTPGQPQAPAPGAPSVPMQQPAQLPPYRALQPGQQGAEPGAFGGAGQVQLPSRPQAAPPAAAPQQLTMQAVMANAPPVTDEPRGDVAYRSYMEQMVPYLSAEGKQAAQAQKQEMEMMKLQNSFLIAQQRQANATTPAEREAARKESNDIRRMIAETAKERADTQRTALGEKTAKGSEKKQASESARGQALALVQRLKAIIAQNPNVVGLRGSLERGAEAVTGAFGGQGTAAHDFQQGVRELQNIIKKYEPYGPEGRVLKGELADRDQIVQGLGSWTSPANALSSFSQLEGFLGRNAPLPETAAPRAAPPAQTTRPVPKDRNQVIKDILTANSMDPSNPDNVKQATEFAKKEGLIK